MHWEVGQIKPQENDKASGIQKSPLHKPVEANTTLGHGTGMGADQNGNN